MYLYRITESKKGEEYCTTKYDFFGEFSIIFNFFVVSSFVVFRIFLGFVNVFGLFHFGIFLTIFLV